MSLHYPKSVSVFKWNTWYYMQTYGLQYMFGYGKDRVSQSEWVIYLLSDSQRSSQDRMIQPVMWSECWFSTMSSWVVLLLYIGFQIGVRINILLLKVSIINRAKVFSSLHLLWSSFVSVHTPCVNCTHSHTLRPTHLYVIKHVHGCDIKRDKLIVCG